jgi:molecular chaperone GrpE (heat shock protein)
MLPSPQKSPLRTDVHRVELRDNNLGSISRELGEKLDREAKEKETIRKHQEEKRQEARETILDKLIKKLVCLKNLLKTNLL